MIPATTIKKEKILHILYAVVFLFFISNSWSQTKVYATLTPNSDHVTSVGNANDSNLTTSAQVKSYSGILGIAPYNGFIELKFATDIPANTISYVKITTQDDVLGSLLGGSLGNLVLSLVSSKQQFTVEANYNGGTPLLTGQSEATDAFANDRLRIVQNATGDYLIAIKPNAVYNRIKLTNRLGASLLALLGETRTLNVFDAYYITSPPVCATPTYTSFSGTGITLDLLNLGTAGVTNPPFAIDASTTNFSTLNLGLLGVGSAIEQTVYFDNLSGTTDSFGITLSMGSGLLGLDVLNNITITASNGGIAGESQSQSLSQLLTLSLLNMQAGVVTTVPMTPGIAVDRITVRFASFLGSNAVAQSLNFYGVKRTLGMPVITQNAAICQGSTASLIATTTTGTSLKWYSDVGGTTLLATRASGVVFETPVLSAPQTYYVSQISGTCEGLLRPVTVNVLTKPGAGSIAGVQTVCLGKPSGILTSVSATGGAGISYQWESSLNEIDWTTIQGANLAEYQPESLLKTTFFRRITTISSGATTCSSVPSNSIKITVKNCVVISNPMVRQRIKNGS